MKRLIIWLMIATLALSGCSTAQQSDPYRVDTVVQIPVDPTDALSEAPLVAPTELPTDAPTEVPTEAPTEPKETTVKKTTSSSSSGSSSKKPSSGSSASSSSSSSSKNNTTSKKEPAATQPPKATEPPATTAPETLPPETTAPETVPAETTVPETVPAETTVPETVPTETTAPDTVPAETTVPETVPAETTAPETVPVETVPPTEEPTEPPTEEPTDPPYYPGSYGVGGLEYAIVGELNASRVGAGLSELSLDGYLSGIAYLRAMEASSSWSHTRPDGRSYTSALSDYGYGYGAVAELMVYVPGGGDAASIAAKWMNSKSHSENILSDSFSTAGVGVYSTGGMTYVVCLLVG